MDMEAGKAPAGHVSMRIAKCAVERAESVSYNEFYAIYLREKAAGLISGKEGFRVMEPFDESWLADKWYRVDEIARFPVASVGAERQISTYGHYIFAFNDEYLLLGVPGKNEDDDQPDNGASGFALWHAVKGSAIYGYWLVLVHLKTGKITDFQGEKGPRTIENS